MRTTSDNLFENIPDYNLKEYLADKPLTGDILNVKAEYELKGYNSSKNNYLAWIKEPRIYH